MERLRKGTSNMKGLPNQNKETDTGLAAPARNGSKIILLFLFLVFGIGFGAVGLKLFHTAYMQEKDCSASAEGRLVRYEPYHSRGTRTYSPVVEYQAGNETLTATSNISASSRPFKEGGQVTVFYNPDRPDEFYIKGYGLEIEYKIGAVFLLVSIAAIIITILSIILNKINMDKDKKERLLAKIIMAGIFLFLFTVFLLIAGPGITLCLSAAMGVFALYGAYSNKKKKQ